IVFAENPRPSQVVRAAHDGVADYLAWPFSGEELMTACLYCRKFMDEKGGAIVRRQKARNLVENLSQRERQILSFMLRGHSNKDMANTLDLSPRTVEDYRLNALKKLGVTSSSAAIRIGLEADLDTVGRSGPDDSQARPFELS
ncbi:MAG: LuxR C-terminal-related transcriptional regulator, partial [Novosphingobium sp.]|nr:LuxR C-terminal-related transcriptional regulator [Novosphingobium sp.]